MSFGNRTRAFTPSLVQVSPPVIFPGSLEQYLPVYSSLHFFFRVPSPNPNTLPSLASPLSGSPLNRPSLAPLVSPPTPLLSCAYSWRRSTLACSEQDRALLSCMRPGRSHADPILLMERARRGSDGSPPSLLLLLPPPNFRLYRPRRAGLPAEVSLLCDSSEDI